LASHPWNLCKNEWCRLAIQGRLDLSSRSTQRASSHQGRNHKAFPLEGRDIEDRAKADPFVKGLTLLQSFWVTCNIIARAGYHLPISPLEISTVAYVACAAVTYTLWWYKPKDMLTPITVFLSYNHDSEDMPHEARQVLGRSGEWVAHTNEDSTSLKQNLVLTFAIPQSTFTKISKVFTGLGKKNRQDESAGSVSLFDLWQNRSTYGASISKRDRQR
jgi:hypothetical protein